MKFAQERSRKAALLIYFQLGRLVRRISASEIAWGRWAGQLDVVQYQLQNSFPFHWGRSIGSWLRAGVALYLGLVVLGATVGLAHDNEAASEESGARQFSEADYVVDFWRTEQGLPHNTVNAILQTRDGYLWLGTASGLVRFDGLNFTPVGVETAAGLQDARVTALLEDRHGVVWVGTQGGGVFRLHHGQAEQLTMADGLADNAVTSLAEDTAGTVWLGTQRGLNRWRNQRLELFASNTLRAGDTVVALHAGRSGAMWVTTRAEVYKLQGEVAELFRLANSPPDRNGELRGAYEDRAGNLWTFSATFLLNLSRDRRYNAFRSLDPASSRVWTISEQDDGTFWIGTSGRGLVRFFQGRFDVVGTREGLDQCDVRALFADHEGNLWIGTSGNGLARLRVRQWRIFTGTDGLVSPKLTTITMESNGILWIGTEDAGVVRFNGTRFESFAGGVPFQRNMHIQSLCVDRSGALWAGTWGDGVIRMAGDRQWRFGTAEGLSDNVVTVVAAEPGTDAVWAGTRSGGLHRISETNITSFGVPEGLTGEAVRCLLFTRSGRLIIGSDGGGLVGWDGQRLALVPSPAGIGAQPVRCLTEDRAGQLWVGTAGGGVFCRAGGNWVNLTTANGLASDSIGEIVQDGAGHFWFGSDQGVFQVRAMEMQGVLRGTMRTVTSVLAARGQGAAEVKSAAGWPAALLTPAGALWFASNGGLLLVDPFNVKAAATPRVMIERVLVDGRSVSLAEHVSDKKPIQLGPGVRSLDFAFTAISFNAPEKTRFRHKMEGFDTDWVQSDIARRVHYGPLPPGSYRFRVIACSADGVWGQEGAAVAVVVLPPIWRAWWFITLCGATLVGGIWLVVRYVSLRRLRAQLKESEQRRAMERERTRIAQDMHDEIGSKLTRISFLSEVVRNGGGNSGEDSNTVAAIADTSRELLQALDEIVWAVNPRNDNLEHLVGYLEQYAREYFLPTPVECVITVPPTLPKVELSAELRHNVFLAFEEALGNTLKHADPSRVDITMTVRGAEFEIVVQDNGRGFAASEAARAGHDGLTNMRVRLRAVGGECVTESELGQGTSVRLRCPLSGAVAR
jgi:ligand-binding sensor domain-containing protein/signal transduction histidine kinase